MDVSHITLVLLLFLNLLHLATSQATGSSPSPKCLVSWQRYNNTNHRNAFKASSQPSEQGCLDECIGTPGCLAVDVDKRNITITYFFECWFHGNDADLDISYSFPGVDTYVKKVTCPAGIVPGMPGAEQLWKQMGPTGATGPTGLPGFPGHPGKTGMNGAPGFTGNTGSSGETGQTGDTGSIGATGYQGGTGFTGPRGQNGFTGIAGSKGTSGPKGANGLGVYLKSTSCSPTWAILKNVRSPGAATTYLLSSLDLCLSQCLALASCEVFEFTSNTSSCAIPTYINNVNTKMTAPGTDQVVITSRCSTKGQTDFTGFITSGVTGATGAAGASGATGPSGLTGSTGATGATGMTGSTGYTGMTGYTGATGGTGYVGLTGIPGSKGDTGSQGPPGNTLYFKDQCEPTWVIINDVTSPGYSPYPGATTVDECMDFCLATPSCVAVDFLVTRSPCRIIKNLGSLNDKIKTPGAIQLVLVERCPLDAGSSNSVPPAGNYAPLKAGGNLKFPGDPTLDEGHQPWPLTFLFTLLSILVTDGVCGIVIFTWKKCSRKNSLRRSPGVQNLAVGGSSDGAGNGNERY